MEAEIELAGEDGLRTIKADDLYQDDGIQYLTKKPEELLTMPAQPASAYAPTTSVSPERASADPK